jgi:cyclohexanone monooxygenase
MSTESAPPPGETIDVEKIREKYRAERDKRRRPQGTDQYYFVDGKYAQFDEDLYTAAPLPRESIHLDLDVLVIGGGLGGLQVGATLGRNEINDFRIIDVAADFGGTWYWNRYPGLRCDVESYIYLPFLEETGYMPTERYIRGSEIFAYCQRLGRHFDLYDRALFQTKITGMRWENNASRWIVETSRGDVFRARFVTTQSGIFNRPQLPGIAGLEKFKGRAFHSSRWDYAYTGGSTHGDLDKLSDKRVGVIGTGATALQVVPTLAACAKHLSVFQRTPTAVGVRDNGPTDAEWFNALPRGWQKAREKSFNQIANGENVPCPVDDGWAKFFRSQIDAVEAIPENERTASVIAAAQEAADFQYNETIRTRVDQYVHDSRQAALLKAYYRTLCKRPGFADDYLPVFNQENVDLVDVSSGIERLTEGGMVVEGMEHKLDCLIFCTGFELGTTWQHQAGYDVVGRDDQRLSEKWAEGLLTYHGLFSHGFPNIFFMGLTQTGTTISVPHFIQEQVNHLTYVIKRSLDEGFSTVEATEEAEASWQKVMAEVNKGRLPFQEACSPGYFNAEGQVTAGDRRSAISSGIYFPSTKFFEVWEQWREAGKFAGLEVD